MRMRGKIKVGLMLREKGRNKGLSGRGEMW
jgi:hypothetical protein